MADPSPRRAYVQILSTETNDVPRVVWEGSISLDGLRKLMQTASSLWLDELGRSAKEFKREVRNIVPKLIQNRDLVAAKLLLKIGLRQAAKTWQKIRERTS